MKTIQFSVTDKEKDLISAYSITKGLTPSALSKFALYQYMTKYPISSRSINKPQLAVQPESLKCKVEEY